MRELITISLAAIISCAPISGSAATATQSPVSRARSLGVPFPGNPGRFNAITDVAGVEVGQTTLIRGDGPLQTGKGPVRTGVTIIHPLGKSGLDAVAAGFSTINGTGEFTGTRVIEETGLLLGPIALTGTGNIAVVDQAMIDWATRPGYMPMDQQFLRVGPVIGETLDHRLNDVFGHPMTEQDVFSALDSASGGPVAEGNVGGGTGMQAYQFKGGIGTASRVVKVEGKVYTVGVLLQANNGRREDLRVAGVPVGEILTTDMPEGGRPAAKSTEADKNSLLVVIATDAPLEPHQLQRLARRAALGIGRDGSTAGNTSGEFALAFSTTNRSPLSGVPQSHEQISDLDDKVMNGLFVAAVQATEEAIINQLVASRTMIGANGYKVYELPHDRLVEILKAHGMIAGGH
jgi:L-aminopeptidase/D-esterase-like protein